mgnify:CR=1 FL=1
MWKNIYKLVSEDGLKVKVANEIRIQQYYLDGILCLPEDLPKIFKIDDALIDASEAKLGTLQLSSVAIKHSFKEAYESPQLFERLITGTVNFNLLASIASNVGISSMSTGQYQSWGYSA